MVARWALCATSKDHVIKEMNANSGSVPHRAWNEIRRNFVADTAARRAELKKLLLDERLKGADKIDMGPGNSHPGFGEASCSYPRLIKTCSDSTSS